MAKLHETKAPARVPGTVPRPGSRRPDSGADANPSAAEGARRREEPAAVKELPLVELDGAQVWSRVQRLALQQLDRLVALEPKVLRDESPKPVHDLRVASRRVQSLLDFLYASPRPPQVQKLRRRLKRVRGILGDLRNQDVMTGRTGRVLARKRATHGEAWQAIHDYILERRPKIAARAHRKLTRINLVDVYRLLRKELTDEVKSSAAAPGVIAFPEKPTIEETSLVPEEAASQAEPQVARTPASRFAERLGELWKEFEIRAMASQREPSGLHPLRIAAKRLRYTIEVAADLEVPGSTEALDWLRELQGKLGDWHDAEVLSQTMVRMIARRKFLEGRLALGVEVGQLVLRLRDSRTRSCQAYLRATLNSPEYERTGQWIAQWLSASGRAVRLA